MFNILAHLVRAEWEKLGPVVSLSFRPRVAYVIEESGTHLNFRRLLSCLSHR